MSAEMVRVVRLPPPDQLPESNLTSAKFKPFYNHTIAFLGQNPDSDLYMRGGAYEKWKPQNSVLPNKRIERLLGKDLAFPPEPLMKIEALTLFLTLIFSRACIKFVYFPSASLRADLPASSFFRLNTSMLVVCIIIF